MGRNRIYSDEERKIKYDEMQKRKYQKTKQARLSDPTKKASYNAYMRSYRKKRNEANETLLQEKVNEILHLRSLLEEKQNHNG